MTDFRLVSISRIENKKGSRVSILTRPDDYVVKLNPKGAYTVTERTFLGMQYMLNSLG